MKKVLLATAMTLALGTSFSVTAGDDVLIAKTDTSTAAVGGGATATATDSSASVSVTDSANQSANGVGNAELSNAFNDINSDNVTTIAEDGIVAHANELNQAVAQSDSAFTISGNEVVMDGALNDASALSPQVITVSATTRTSDNLLGGSFTHFSGISAVDQNIGSTSAVAQSVVVQSNGGI